MVSINEILNKQKSPAVKICMLLLLFSCFFIGCSKPQPKQLPPPPVKVETLEIQNVEDFTDYIATLISKKSINLSPRVSGPIQNIYVKDGSFVKQGTVIMDIEYSEQQSIVSASKAQTESVSEDIKQAEYTLKSLYAQKESNESQVELSKIQYDRYKSLYDSGSATKQDYDTYTNEYNQAIAQLKSTNQQINAQEKIVKSKQADYKESIEKLNQSQITADYYRIKAPFDGYLGDISLKIGEYISPQTTVTTLTQGNLLEIHIGVDSDYKDKIKLDMPIKLIDSDENILTKAKAYFISPVIDKPTQTILIKAWLDNSSNKFNPDQVVNARVVWGMIKTLTVPTGSVINFSGQDFVYVINKEKGTTIAKQRPVKLDKIVKDRYILLDGLKPGEQIITTGIQKIRDGIPVNIQK